MLAPLDLQFYNSRWALIGTKEELGKELSKITRIPIEAITAARSLRSFSAAARMSWASERVTTREEDIAYCLLGLFDVHMPLVYGEGNKAFYRLQEEIIKKTFDPSLFAWQPDDETAQTYLSVLATSPADFRKCGLTRPFMSPISEYSMTNRGLKMTASLIPYESPSQHIDEQLWSNILPIGVHEPGSWAFGIVLLRTAPGVYIRLASPGFVPLKEDFDEDGPSGECWGHLADGITHAFHILADIDEDTVVSQANELRRIFCPRSVELQAGANYAPSYRGRLAGVHTLPPLPYYITAFSSVAMVFGRPFPFGIIFDSRENVVYPKCLLIDKSTWYSRLFFLLLLRDPNTPMSWDIVNKELPEISGLTDHLIMEYEGKSFELAARVIEPKGYQRTPRLDVTVAMLGPSATTKVHEPNLAPCCEHLPPMG